MSSPAHGEGLLREVPVHIPVAEPVEIGPGIVVLRLPLPFRLDHINVYLLDEGSGWTLVDCGLHTAQSISAWEAAWQRPLLRGRPIQRIVVTHHHPDHIGLAGWLARRFDVPVWITHGEREVAGRYADPRRDVVAERSGLWLEHGLPAGIVGDMSRQLPRYSRHVHPLPEPLQRLDPAQPVAAGGRRWQPVIGQGHSPEHLSLHAPADGILIAGDQVLPQITPNIAVWPGGDQDPLGSYLASLRQFADLPGDPLVLPSHRQPFRGLALRVAQIRAHHEERLRRVMQACTRPMTCLELIPALFGRELQPQDLGFGLGEGVAHLNYLANRGLMRSELDAAGVRRFEPTACGRDAEVTA